MGMVFLLAAIAPAVLVIRLGRADSDTWSHIGMHVTQRRWTYLVAAWALMAGGLVLLIVRTTGALEATAPTITRLQPLGVWMLLSGAATAAALLLISRRSRDSLAFVVLLTISLAGGVGHVLIWPAQESMINDIYHIFREGERLRQGDNPYERILDEAGEEVRKPLPYLPPIYYISASIQSLGFDGFLEWVAVWRMVSLGAALAVASALFLYCYSTGQGLLGAIAALFWLFNRWTLHVARTADMDFLPIAFLVLGSIQLARQSKRSLLLLGASLAIKHYAMFLVPVFLITLWRFRPLSVRREVLTDTLRVGGFPLLVSIPFLAINAGAFLRSILYQLTRNPQASGQVITLDGILGWTGLAARLPMFGLILLAYAGHVRARWKPLMASLLVMAIVIFFNSVYFTSYMAWLAPLIPLAAAEAFSPVHAGPDPGTA
jgi:hypothetical protein